MLANTTYELKSLKNRLKSILKLQTRKIFFSNEGNMHIIRKASVPNSFIDDVVERTKTKR